MADAFAPLPEAGNNNLPAHLNVSCQATPVSSGTPTEQAFACEGRQMRQAFAYEGRQMRQAFAYEGRQDLQGTLTAHPLAFRLSLTQPLWHRVDWFCPVLLLPLLQVCQFLLSN